MENRSKAILGMEDSAFARSLFKSMGYTDSDCLLYTSDAADEL